ncbi:MAG: FAD-dependent oxidoreductase, partial [Eubacteriales bacterium]|nr:FAD-dependent oxidoreductase [Eubacteriales bacterium]
GRETDGKLQAASGTVFIGGVGMEEMFAYFRTHPRELRPIDVSSEALEELIDRMPSAPVFGMGAFREIIARAHAEGSLYPRDTLVGQAFPQTGELMLVGSRVENADPTNVTDYTRAEIQAQLQMESILHLLKNYIPGCKNAHMIGSGHTLGIRESCHVQGDYLLTAEDLMQGKSFEDVIALGAYHLDVHAPDHPGIDSGCPPVYQIPYRSLLPQKIEGVLVAGRAFSATQLAQASTRVIPIAAATGQAAGIAAGLASKEACSLRAIEIQKLQRLLRENGALLPPL